ncbi:3D domain-containing protein [Sporolactobacillus kofuensis]|uniref:3D domain-containing protein n=1 Tax=Sporolactobacillus kofuensis TaxID=269672 RepID=A0ABW1WIA8_9BACL|nr:3D domain-containing protein [Sporolactobacillus kofuensis]
MNIIKRLTAMTSLTVCLGVLAPTTIVFAKTNSTNDNHIMNSENPVRTTHAIGFAANAPSDQADNQNVTIIFGNSLLQKGDSGPVVAKLQDKLQKLGYLDGQHNGIIDEQTFEAIDAFQSDKQDFDNGIIGADTKTALYTVYRNTKEAKDYQEKAVEIKVQEKKEAEEKARQAAEAKKRAKEAAQKAAKAAEKKAAERAKENASKPKVQNTSYQPKEEKKQSAPAGQSGQSITVEATSYSLSGRTATGIDFSSNPNAKVIAVDPAVIPLGSRVMIPGYGVYLAADTGGAIKGNRIDVHLPSKNQALNFGRKTITIKILH